MKKEKTIYRGGCINCPATESFLSLDTVLYNGFGGYHIEKDGEIFYVGDANGDWDSFLTLEEIEKRAQKNPQHVYKCILDNPLRGATWVRNNKGTWLLKETNQGFA